MRLKIVVTRKRPEKAGAKRLAPVLPAIELICGGKVRLKQ